MGPYREPTRTRYRREWQHFIDESANDEDFFYEEDYPYCDDGNEYDDYTYYGNRKCQDDFGCGTHNLTVEAGGVHATATADAEEEILHVVDDTRAIQSTTETRSPRVSLEDFFTDASSLQRASPKKHKREKKARVATTSLALAASSSYAPYVTLDEDGTIWECSGENVVNMGEGAMIVPLEAVLPFSAKTCSSEWTDSWNLIEGMDEKLEVHDASDDLVVTTTRPVTNLAPRLRRTQSSPLLQLDHDDEDPQRRWSSRDRFRGMIRCTNLVLDEDDCRRSASSTLDLSRSMDIFCTPFRSILTITWSAGSMATWERLLEQGEVGDLDWTQFEIQVVPLLLPSALSDSDAVTKDMLACVERMREEIHALVRTTRGNRNATVEKPGNMLSSFAELSRLLSRLRTNICDIVQVEMYRTFPSFAPSEGDGSNLQSVLRKARLSDVSHSLDDYDVYERTEPFRRKATQKQYEDQLWQDAQMTTNAFQRCFECPPLDDEAPPNMENVCMVCFDDLSTLSDENVIQLLPCGHRACLECWRGNLESASRSGETNIRCLAFRCPTVLTIHDIANLLVEREGDDEGTRRKNNSTLRKLVRYHLDHSTMLHLCEEGKSENTKRTEAPDVRFCGTPSCKCVHLAAQGDTADSLNKLLGNLVDDKHNDNDVHGTDLAIQHLIRGAANIWLCGCGATYCGNCKTGTASPAHVGLSCKNFAKLRKALEQIEGEVKSLEWMKANTRPCPKCKFPIQKNGGCNHMWCNKCGYYFCWMCGGPGGECRAFVCTKNNLLWHQEAEGLRNAAQDDQHQIPSLVVDYKNYRLAHQNVQRIIRRRTAASSQAAVAGTHDEEIEPDLQLYQILLWQCLVLLFFSSEPKQQRQNSALVGAIRKSKERLELLIHSKNLRQLAQSMGITVAEIVCNGGALSISVASNLEQASALHPAPGGKKTPSKRKEQALQSIAQKRQDRGTAKVGEDTFQLMMADEELAALCEMDDKAFASTLSVNMVRCVRTLVEDKKSPQKQGVSAGGGTGVAERSSSAKNKSHDTDTAYLNEKGKALSGWRSRRSSSVDDDNDDDDSDMTVAAKCIRWKGKTRSRGLRNAALERRFL